MIYTEVEIPVGQAGRRQHAGIMSGPSLAMRNLEKRTGNWDQTQIVARVHFIPIDRSKEWASAWRESDGWLRLCSEMLYSLLTRWTGTAYTILGGCSTAEYQDTHTHTPRASLAGCTKTAWESDAESKGWEGRKRSRGAIWELFYCSSGFQPAAPEIGCQTLRIHWHWQCRRHCISNNVLVYFAAIVVMVPFYVYTHNIHTRVVLLP